MWLILGVRLSLALTPELGPSTLIGSGTSAARWAFPWEEAAATNWCLDQHRNTCFLWAGRSKAKSGRTPSTLFLPLHSSATVLFLLGWASRPAPRVLAIESHRARLRGPRLRVNLCSCRSEVCRNFILQSVFCRGNPMGPWGMLQGLESGLREARLDPAHEQVLSCPLFYSLAPWSHPLPQ